MLYTAQVSLAEFIYQTVEFAEWTVWINFEISITIAGGQAVDEARQFWECDTLQY